MTNEHEVERWRNENARLLDLLNMARTNLIATERSVVYLEKEIAALREAVQVETNDAVRRVLEEKP